MDFSYYIKRFLASFLPLFVIDKAKRKKLRRELKQKALPDVNNMKLGISYSVWDSEELLEASLRSVRKEADYINVVWQELSWHGEKCSDDLPKVIEDLKNKGLIDEVIFYPCNGKCSSPPREERKKRNVGLEAAKKAGCNYFLTMDADEFYDANEMHAVKKQILKRGLDYTACNIFTYWKDPSYRKIDPDRFAVPFICKIDKSSKLIRNSHYPCYADGTREINVKKSSKFLYLNIIAMHHMTFIRKDIQKKLDNAATANPDFAQEAVDTYQNLSDDNLEKYGFIKTENTFDIKVDW